MMGVMDIAKMLGGGGGDSAPLFEPPVNVAALEPYIGAGERQLGQYEEFLGQMQDPQAYLSQILEGYEQSPFAQQQVRQGTQAIRGPGAIGGMTGSGPEMAAIERQAQEIAQADQQRYLQNIFGIGQQFQSGASNIAGMGEQAIFGQMQEQARRQEREDRMRREKEAQKGAMFRDIASAAGTAAGFAFI